MPHPSEAELHTWLDGERDASGDVGAHLERCAECRRRLEEVRGLHSRVSEILDVATAEPAEPPPFESVRLRAGREERARRGRRLASGRLPQMAWVASVVLALAAGWLARQATFGSRLLPPAAELEESRAERAGAANEARAADEAGAGRAGRQDVAAPEVTGPGEEAQSFRERAAGRAPAPSPETTAEEPKAAAPRAAADLLLRAAPEADVSGIAGCLRLFYPPSAGAALPGWLRLLPPERPGEEASALWEGEDRALVWHPLGADSVRIRSVDSPPLPVEERRRIELRLRLNGEVRGLTRWEQGGETLETEVRGERTDCPKRAESATAPGR